MPASKITQLFAIVSLQLVSKTRWLAILWRAVGHATEDGLATKFLLHGLCYRGRRNLEFVDI